MPMLKRRPNTAAHDGSKRINLAPGDDDVEPATPEESPIADDDASEGEGGFFLSDGPEATPIENFAMQEGVYRNRRVPALRGWRTENGSPRFALDMDGTTLLLGDLDYLYCMSFVEDLAKMLEIELRPHLADERAVYHRARTLIQLHEMLYRLELVMPSDRAIWNELPRYFAIAFAGAQFMGND